MAQDPFRPVDDDARSVARQLVDDARFGALGVLHRGLPMVTRVSVMRDDDGVPLTLISDLSTHTQALRADPRCSLLLGEPGDKGDPLTHPRITLQAKAEFLEKSEALVARCLSVHPKAKLYIGFADFNFARFEPSEAYLNGGFGKAYRMRPSDLSL